MSFKRYTTGFNMDVTIEVQRYKPFKKFNTIEFIHDKELQYVIDHDIDAYKFYLGLNAFLQKAFPSEYYLYNINNDINMFYTHSCDAGTILNIIMKSEDLHYKLEKFNVIELFKVLHNTLNVDNCFLEESQYC